MNEIYKEIIRQIRSLSERERLFMNKEIADSLSDVCLFIERNMREPKTNYAMIYEGEEMR